MTLKTVRPHGEPTKFIHKSVYLREAVDHAARVWFLTGAKPGKFWTYIEHKWVEISIQFNGEENPPRRRAEDKEIDHLAPRESIDA